MALGGSSTSSGGRGTGSGGRGRRRGRGRGRGGARGRSDVGDRGRGEAMGRGDVGDAMHIENGGRVDEEEDIALIVESLQWKASQGDFHKRPINGVKLVTVHFVDRWFITTMNVQMKKEIDMLKLIFKITGSNFLARRRVERMRE
ncbi:hypothetical protein AgCh_023852 [Apium graveolens]